MICSNKRHLIKKRFLSPIPKVFGPRGGKLCHERGPRGYLRKPLKGTIVGEQADTSKILQAYYAEGCANLCQSLQQVSEIRQCHQTTLRGTHSYDGPMAIRSMGIRYHGSFPNSSQAVKFLIVGINYFIKWMEAKALAIIMEKNIRSFIWKNIICKYGIPRVLVSNNGKQFDNSAFREFYSELGIKNHYSSPAHP